MAQSNPADDSGTGSNGGPVEPGDLAADREKSEVVLVLEVHDEQAKNFAIPALAGRTVAECKSNSGYPDDDRVVEIVYVSSLNYQVREQKDMDWTPKKVLGMYQGNNLTRYNLRSYSVPVSRLREIDA
jgi:hypothetical protein